ncbi:MAG: hypothetical protein MI920_01380 [Kiloniellales bacterium]|nr:hypothetical protein [Kiloniellales bacterium]
MPTEVRRLTFSQDEIIDALAAGKIEPAAASGGPLSIVSREDGAPMVAFGSEAGEKCRNLETSVLGAALIKYCLDQGIPIPRNASRSLALHKGELALYLHIDEEADEVNVPLPDYYDYDFYG